MMYRSHVISAASHCLSAQCRPEAGEAVRVLLCPVVSVLYRNKRKMATAEARAKEKAFQFNKPFLRQDSDSLATTPVDTEVVGEIPGWLEGSLYRNGPGIFRVGEDYMRHLFDGFAVLHRFHLHGGKVTYTSRALDTDTYLRSMKAHRLISTQFGTFQSPDPCKSLLGKIMSFFKPGNTSDATDNVSVNIVEHGDRLYAMTETPWMVQVDPDALTRTVKEDLKTTIAVHMSTAHPHFDHHGNMYNLGTAFNPPNNYNIVKIPPPDSPDTKAVSGAQLLVALQSRWKFTMGYNHSFGMSRGHFIILEQPVAMRSFKFLTNNWRKAPAYENFDKYPNEELIFRIVRRSDNTEVNIKFRADPAFTFHFINCFEDQGQLVVDFVGYSSLDIIDELYLHNIDGEAHVEAKPYFRRYVLPLTLEGADVGVNLVKLPYSTATAVLRRNGTVFLTPDYVIEGKVSMELPRINYDRNNAEKYRYVYGTTLFSEDSHLVKLDLDAKSTLTWKDEGYSPGEPVFVPSPEATGEDEGVILSPLLSIRGDQKNYLVVLDAATFQELGRAYAPENIQMPLSFHGTYVSPKDGKK